MSVKRAKERRPGTVQGPGKTPPFQIQMRISSVLEKWPRFVQIGVEGLGFALSVLESTHVNWC